MVRFKSRTKFPSFRSPVLRIRIPRVVFGSRYLDYLELLRRTMTTNSAIVKNLNSSRKGSSTVASFGGLRRAHSKRRILRSDVGRAEGVRN